MKKHVICTACDRKYGDFFINHWLRSLQDNVCLDAIDVVVFDYGFTDEQRNIIDGLGVIRIECVRDGHVVIIRFRDLADYLDRTQYDQVFMCDSGDIIFQSDIMDIFSYAPTMMRATYDTTNLLFQGYVNNIYFRTKDLVPLQRSLMKHRMINAGVLVGPAHRFSALCRACYRLVKNKQYYGPDQLAIHYLLYRDGFTVMSDRYNCVVLTTDIPFTVVDGIFYDDDGKVIPVIHNAGKSNIFRGVKNFGYGPQHNQLKLVHKYVMMPFNRLGKRFFVR